MRDLREEAKKHSAVFVGPARNCGQYLKKVMENIDRIGSLFSSYEVVIVESDSTDNTLEVLNEIVMNNPNVHGITLGNIEDSYPVRAMRIGAARNIGIRFCEDNGLLDKHSLYIQMCVDDVSAEEIELDGVLKCFEFDDWAGMTANQNTYYDLWTLRTKDDWMNYNCWWRVQNKPYYMSRDDAYNIYIGSKFIKIPKEYGFIEVDAAHGGFSIYKSEYAKGCRYKGFDSILNFEESDIQEFCRGIRVKGGKIFINSSMINIHNN